MTLGPILRAAVAVVGFGEDKGDPGGGEDAVGQSQVQVMAAQVAFEEIGRTELLYVVQRQLDVIDTFMPQQEGCCFHPAVLSHSAQLATSYANAGYYCLRCARAVRYE